MHRRHDALVALVAVALLAPACSLVRGRDGDTPNPTTSDAPVVPLRRPVVVDTDMGVDDLMALLYLLSRPDLEVRAITVSGTGLAHCDGGIRTALGLLSVLGPPHDSVPVACGRPAPLVGDHAFPDEWRAAADEGSGLELPPVAPPFLEKSAPELLVATIEESDVPVEVLTLGPLTNLADAFQTSPGLAERVAGVHIMGGALQAAGNIFDNAVAEWNVWVDPTALDIVLRTGAPVTLVPLDATNAVPGNAFFRRALDEHAATPAAGLVLDLFEANPFLAEGEWYFWDPLAAASLADPSLVTAEARRVRVIHEGDPKLFGWILEDEGGTEVRVAMDADQLAFESEFLSTLNGEPVVVERPEPVLRFGHDGAACTFEGPETVTQGPVAIGVENAGTQPLGIGAARLRGGHDRADLEAWLRDRGTEEFPRWAAFAGFGGAGPGEEALLLWELKPGLHVVGCSVGETGPPVLLGSVRVTA